jgi:hypothetical protein
VEIDVVPSGQLGRRSRAVAGQLQLLGPPAFDQLGLVSDLGFRRSPLSSLSSDESGERFSPYRVISRASATI